MLMELIEVEKKFYVFCVLAKNKRKYYTGINNIIDSPPTKKDEEYRKKMRTVIPK